MSDPDIRFRQSFALFLRRYPAWRQRRRDFYIPLDFYAAQRQITVQGRITEDLLEEFVRTTPGVAVPARFAAGEPFILLIPFALFPKQLLLDFSTFGPKGDRIPLTTRFEGSRLTGTYLLSLFHQAAYPELDIAQRGLALLLETIAGVDPTSLLDRVRRTQKGWRKRRTYSPVLDDLPEWFRRECEFFSRGWGPTVSGDDLTILIERAHRSAILAFADYVHEQEDDLLAFDTLATLVLYGVRESLRILADQGSRGRLDVRTPRRDLLHHYIRLVRSGLRALDRMLNTPLEPGGRHPPAEVKQEIARAAWSWMAYLSVPVQLDVPFHLRSAELLPFRQHNFVRRQLIRARTYHRYRAHLHDAQVSHIEIQTDDPNLTIGRRQSRVRFGRGLPQRPDKVFGREYKDSISIVHFYSAAAPWEQPLRNQEGALEMRIRYRLTRTVFWGYALLLVLLAVVIGWNSVEWFGKPPSPDGVLGLLTVDGTFGFLIALLMTIDHRKPLVQGKLAAFRAPIALALLALVAEPVVAWLQRL